MSGFGSSFMKCLKTFFGTVDWMSLLCLKLSMDKMAVPGRSQVMPGYSGRACEISSHACLYAGPVAELSRSQVLPRGGGGGQCLSLKGLEIFVGAMAELRMSQTLPGSGSVSEPWNSQTRDLPGSLCTNL